MARVHAFVIVRMPVPLLFFAPHPARVIGVREGHFTSVAEQFYRVGVHRTSQFSLPSKEKDYQPKQNTGT